MNVSLLPSHPRSNDRPHSCWKSAGAAPHRRSKPNYLAPPDTRSPPHPSRKNFPLPKPPYIQRASHPQKTLPHSSHQTPPLPSHQPPSSTSPPPAPHMPPASHRPTVESPPPYPTPSTPPH